MAEAEIKTEAATDAKPQAKKLLFNKWDVSEVKVTDPSLVRYVNLTPRSSPTPAASTRARSSIRPI